MNSDLAAQKAMDRFARVGFAGLNESERLLATVWLFEAGVGNQGLIGYFASDKGDLAFFAPEALRKIGANGLAAIAAEANSVFGAEGPPRERESRRQVIRKFAAADHARLTSLEKQYFECEEDADKLLEEYLARASS